MKSELFDRIYSHRINENSTIYNPEECIGHCLSEIYAAAWSFNLKESFVGQQMISNFNSHVQLAHDWLIRLQNHTTTHTLKLDVIEDEATVFNTCNLPSIWKLVRTISRLNSTDDMDRRTIHENLLQLNDIISELRSIINIYLDNMKIIEDRERYLPNLVIQQ